jgi:hypothetical protein
MAEQDDEWFDEAAGRLVRLYALTRGRTSPTNNQLDVATQVIAARSDFDRMALEPEYMQIVELCRRWLSVAEVAAYLKVPLVVAKVQLSDLIDRGAVVVSSAAQETASSDRELLQAIIDRLHAL